MAGTYRAAGPRWGWRKLRALREAYFAQCREEHRHPSLPGLALALGFNSRQEMEQALLQEGDSAPILRRAMTLVEEATVQSAFTKELAASAKFILQNGFDYSEKAVLRPPEEIQVLVGEGEKG